MGVCRPVLQKLTLFQAKKWYFPHPFSDLAFKIHTHFQTWSPRNLLSLLRLERKIKFEFLYYSFFISQSFGIETKNSTFIHSVVPSKTTSDSRSKWAKCIPDLRPKRCKKTNHTLWGGTYPYLHITKSGDS